MVPRRRIIVAELGEGFRACYENHPERWAAGSSAAEAVGQLVLTSECRVFWNPRGQIDGVYIRGSWNTGKPARFG